MSLNDYDKRERSANVVRAFVRLGFKVIATQGTSKFLNDYGIINRPVLKASEGTLNIIDVINNGWVQFIINTPLGQTSRKDEHAIGRAALEHKVPFITTISAAAFAAKSIEGIRQQKLSVLSIQEHHELAAQGGEAQNLDSIEDCSRLVEYIKSFQM